MRHLTNDLIQISAWASGLALAKSWDNGSTRVRAASASITLTNLDLAHFTELNAMVNVAIITTIRFETANLNQSSETEHQVG